MARDLGEGAGEFDAGGAAADHHESEPGGAFRGVGFALGALEGEQHAAADFVGILQRFQARRVHRPVVVAEIAVGGAGGDDQAVVGDLVAAIEHHGAARNVDAPRFAVDHGGVLLVGEDVPDRRRHRRRRESRGRHLVQQRLKQVMVGAVDHRDAHRRACECARSEQAAETAAKHDDVRRHG